ncbi:MAG: phosphoribosylanthranilate isomerase [candidate division Zixibacteria bacterium]|nr:phosphoribosylanthranilate isomerase [candidate division Zixibacteria bacterium]
MPEELKQFVPQEVCLACDGCCRFKEDSSEWRPKVAKTELDALLAEPDRTLLLDTYDPGQHGGTGRPFDWEWARRAGERKRIILAGGLNAENIARALEQARPAAIDVSSSLESRPGIKDPRKIEAFFLALRGAGGFSYPSSESHASAS